MLRLSLAFVLLLGLCDRKDETLTGYGAADVTWVLKSIDGIPFSATATVTFPEPGKIAGSAPCNRYFGTQTAPYPWFEAPNIASTKMACPELDAETRFLSALSEMTISEVSKTTLILSNADGRQMIFEPE